MLITSAKKERAFLSFLKTPPSVKIGKIDMNEKSKITVKQFPKSFIVQMFKGSQFSNHSSFVLYLKQFPTVKKIVKVSVIYFSNLSKQLVSHVY